MRTNVYTDRIANREKLGSLMPYMSSYICFELSTSEFHASELDEKNQPSFVVSVIVFPVECSQMHSQLMDTSS